MPDDASRAAVRSRRLAAELRRLRLNSELTGEEVALRLGWSESKISRIELSRTGVKEGDLSRLLDLYHVGPSHRAELLALAREAASRSSRLGWSANLSEAISDYVAAEAEARLVWNWEPRVVPGLLQTADYARAVVEGVQSIFGLPPSDIERRVTARLARQQVLTREQPLELSVVVDESVLRRKFGSRKVMHGQLKYLAERSQAPNVHVYILPLDGEHPIGTGSFTYMQFPQVHAVPLADTVFVEQLVTNFRTEDEDETYKYRLTFERLMSEALPPPESRDLIRHTASEWRD